MNQQIMPNTKNVIQNPLIKVAFQTDIANYIQRKKRQVSVFSPMNKKYSSIEQKINYTSSNLMDAHKQQNIQNQSNQFIQEMINALNKKIDIQQIKINDKYLRTNKKHKGRKSSLSDWRNLYQQRNLIAQKHRMNNNTPNKMIATDRLFYTLKKQNCRKNLGNSQINQQSDTNRTYNYKFIKKIQNLKQKSNEKYFVNDENFFHMYHRSYSPILSDFGYKRRITNYLIQNKERKQSNDGFRRLNEGIFNESFGNEVKFIQQKEQQLQIDLRQKIKLTKKQGKFNIQNEQTMKQQLVDRRKDKLFQASSCRHKNQNIHKNVEQSENPQSPRPLKGKVDDYKKLINLSQIYSETIGPKSIKMENNRALRLDLFKAKKNKIQKGIYYFKQLDQEDNKFPNFEYSLAKPKYRNTFSNWDTLKNQI